MISRGDSKFCSSLQGPGNTRIKRGWNMEEKHRSTKRRQIQGVKKSSHQIAKYMVYISSFTDLLHYPLLSACHILSLTLHRFTEWIFSPLVTQCFGIWTSRATNIDLSGATPDRSTQCPVLQSKAQAASSAPLYHWCLGCIFCFPFFFSFCTFAYFFYYFFFFHQTVL